MKHESTAYLEFHLITHPLHVTVLWENDNKKQDMSITGVGWTWHKTSTNLSHLESQSLCPRDCFDEPDPPETWVGHVGPAKGLLAGLAEWLTLSFVTDAGRPYRPKHGLQRCDSVFFDGFDVWAGCHFNVVEPEQNVIWSPM